MSKFPICPACRTENPEQASFCMACGSPLAGGAQADNRFRKLQRSAPEGLQRKMRAAGQALTGV